MPLRAPIAVVNELSLPPTAELLEPAQALVILKELVGLVRVLQKIRPDLALASAAPLGGLPLTPDGLGFAALAEMHGGAARDEWRYIQSRRNIAPFGESDELRQPSLDVEYRFGDDLCPGLGIAVSSGQLAVSFQTRAIWDVEELQVSQLSLIENDVTGEIVEENSMMPVRHASRIGHVEVHAAFIANLALPDPFSGGDLWADRVARYPNLEFLQRVEDQLRGLGQGSAAVRQVHDRLCELNAAITDWNPAMAPFPAWKSKVNPEHQQRKNLCLFADLDGETRCFDLHAFFTPGEGRIHFRLLQESGTLRIAHIGLKLGI